MGTSYVVQQGDCIASLAYERGLLLDTIWNHPRNRALKTKRKDPYILKPGDVVYIPDIDPKKLDCATRKRHRFKLKGVPAKFKLRLVEEAAKESPPGSRSDVAQGELDHAVYTESDAPPIYETRPRANVQYILQIDGKNIRGVTGDDGSIERTIPPNSRAGTLILEPGTPSEVRMRIRFGSLNPMDEVSGVKQRLANLGIDCGEQSDETDGVFKEAVSLFQERNDLQTTGNPSAETRGKLRDVHGS
jgi:N-acetylmuramoyl-L-alanine amidase